MFLSMNPSEAGALWDDATVAKGWRFARSWDCQRMLVGNVHAYITTDQSRLNEVSDPTGPDNHRHLLGMAQEADLIVIGYGTPKIKALRPAGLAVAQMLINHGHRLYVLRLSKHGIPEHPLYLPASMVPILWTPPMTDCTLA